MASWRSLSKTRMAAMAVSSEQLINLMCSHSYIKEFLSSGDKPKEKKLSVKGELIWDTLCKSGISVGARNALAKCFQIAIGENVMPNKDSNVSFTNKFGKHAFNGKYGLLALIPTQNPNSHNYQMGTVCVTRVSGGRSGALRITGTTGNNLPTFDQNFAVPSVEQMKYFFSSRTGPNLEVIRNFYRGKNPSGVSYGYTISYAAEFNSYIGDKDAAMAKIDNYNNIYNELKKAGMIPVA